MNPCSITLPSGTDETPFLFHPFHFDVLADRADRHLLLHILAIDHGTLAIDDVRQQAQTKDLARIRRPYRLEDDPRLDLFPNLVRSFKVGRGRYGQVGKVDGRVKRPEDLQVETSRGDDRGDQGRDDMPGQQTGDCCDFLLLIESSD